MPMFRPKPVVVEAFQYRPDGPTPVPEWFTADRYFWREGFMYVKTPEGDMRASPGDWIVRGVAGEVYPIKDAVFRETYEPA